MKKTLDYFQIEQIHQSGQCFRMEQISEDTFRVLAADKYVQITQKDGVCSFECSEEEYEMFWKQYFDLEAEYEAFYNSIDAQDIYLKQAAREGRGIRILHQDLWEMIISFLISQQNNIPRIRKCIQNICQRYGQAKTAENGDLYYTFPTAKELSCASEEELRECNLGYRSKYIVRTVEMVLEGQIRLDMIQKMDYQSAREELMKFYGVGEKVADCICLFALHHLEAFPVDTHIRQALDRHYPSGFPFEKYAGYQGILQQYIFYHELFYT